MQIGHRSKNEVQNPYTEADYFKEYKKDIIPNSSYDMDITTFRKILQLYFNRVEDYILLEAGTFKLPFRLGEIKVIKSIPITVKYKILDFKATKEQGKNVYQLNEHSDGYLYKFFWFKKYCNIKNKRYYRFLMARRIKRRLAKLIKSGDYDFLELKQNYD